MIDVTEDKSSVKLKQRDEDEVDGTRVVQYFKENAYPFATKDVNLLNVSQQMFKYKTT